jgi:hypothetical protein
MPIGILVTAVVAIAVSLSLLHRSVSAGISRLSGSVLLTDSYKQGQESSCNSAKATAPKVMCGSS